MPHALSRRLTCTAAAVARNESIRTRAATRERPVSVPCPFGRRVCGLVRGVLEDRVERQAPLIVRGLRARLESGNPPDEVSDPFGKRRLGVH